MDDMTYLLRAKETHSGEVQVRFDVDTCPVVAVVSRPAAILAAIELLLASTNLGREDLLEYFQRMK